MIISGESPKFSFEFRAAPRATVTGYSDEMPSASLRLIFGEAENPQLLKGMGRRILQIVGDTEHKIITLVAHTFNGLAFFVSVLAVADTVYPSVFGV